MCDRFSMYWKYGYENLNRLTRKRIMMPSRLLDSHRVDPVPRAGERERFESALNLVLSEDLQEAKMNFRQQEMYRLCRRDKAFESVYKRIVLRHNYFGTDANSHLLLKAAQMTVFFSSAKCRNSVFKFGGRHKIDPLDLQNAIDIIVGGNRNVRFNGKFPVRCQLEATNKPSRPPFISRTCYDTVETNSRRNNWEPPKHFTGSNPNKVLLVNGCADHTKDILNSWIRNKKKYRFNLRQHCSAIMKHFNWWGLKFIPSFRVDPSNLKYLTFNPSKKLDDFTTKFVGMGRLPKPRKEGYSPSTVISPVMIFSHVVDNLKRIIHNKRLPSFGINFPGGREKDDDLVPNAETLKTRFVAQSITGFQATANFFMLPIKALLKQARGCFPSSYNNSKSQFLSQLALHCRSKSELEGDYKRGEASWGWKNKLVATAFMFSFYHSSPITLRAFEFTLDFELECLKLFGQRLIHELDTGLMSGKGDMGLKWSLQQFFLHSFEYTYFLKKNCGVKNMGEYFPSFFGDDMKHHFSSEVKVKPRKLEKWYSTNTGFNLLGVKHKRNLPGISNKISFLATYFTESGFPAYMPARWATICLLCRPYEKLSRKQISYSKKCKLFNDIINSSKEGIYDTGRLWSTINVYGYSVFNVAKASLRSGLVISDDHIWIILYLYVVGKAEGFVNPKLKFMQFKRDLIVESEFYKVRQASNSFYLSEAKSLGVWNPRESSAKSTYYDVCLRFGYISPMESDLLKYDFKGLYNFSKSKNSKWRTKVRLYLSIYSRSNVFGSKRSEIASTLGTFKTLSERARAIRFAWKEYTTIGRLTFFRVYDTVTREFLMVDRRYICIMNSRVEEFPSSFNKEVYGQPVDIQDLRGRNPGMTL